MSGSTTVQGEVAEGFEETREEFAAVLAEETAEPGAQLAVRFRGRQVVDLWAGEGMSGDTLLALYSSAKGAAHLVVALLVQDGLLDLDRSVASYWPQFAAEGKDRLTVRELVAHRSGVIGVEGGFSDTELADDRLLAARLAGQKPYWEPGAHYGYHAFVIGALTGEVVRRATGRSIQEWYEERVRAPYGLDFHLGLPESEEARYQPVRPMLPSAEQQAELDAGVPAGSLLPVAFNQNGPEPTDLVAWANLRSVRALGPASSGAVGTARGLARMYAATIGEVDGRPPLLTDATRAEFTELRWPGTDLVTGEIDHFLLGFEAQGVRYSFLGRDAFGHSGAVGADAFADPGTSVAYSYTRRRFSFPGGAAPENQRLAAVVLRCAKRALGQ